MDRNISLMIFDRIDKPAAGPLCVTAPLGLEGHPVCARRADNERGQALVESGINEETASASTRRTAPEWHLADFAIAAVGAFVPVFSA